MIRTVDICCLSAQGGVSEDSVGLHVGNEAAVLWVIDGTTGLGGRNLTSCGFSDAAWYAQSLSRALWRGASAEVAGQDLRQLATRAIADVNAAFEEIARGQAICVKQLPSASLVCARIRRCGDEFETEICQAGDSVAPLWSAERLDFVASTLAADFDAEFDALAAQIANSEQPERSAELRRAAADALERRRMTLNHPDGSYSVVAPNFDIGQLRCVSLRHESSPFVALLSDGAFRIVDKFRELDLAGLARLIESRGSRSVLRRVRRREAGDPLGRRYPRLKPSDDASVVCVSLG